MSTPESANSPVAARDAGDQPLLATRHRGLLLVGVILVSLCQFFDATIANVALPHMKTALGASNESIGWVLTSFMIATAIGTPITGWLSDYFGSRNVFMIATVAFLLSSAACGASVTLPEMVTFRILQGLASAFIGPLTMTIMFDVSPPSKQATAMSLYGMMVMVAPITGPFIGAFLTEYLSWRWIYYVNLPLGIPALVLLWWLLPCRPIVKRKLDMFGFVTIAVALGALQLMFDRGQGRDWFASREVVFELILAISALWIFAPLSLPIAIFWPACRSWPFWARLLPALRQSCQRCSRRYIIIR
jgi:DHA2 family multidrug resistance protein